MRHGIKKESGMISLGSNVALITGAARGVGAAAALKLATAGASVIVGYSTHRKEAEMVAEKARLIGVRAMAIGADISDFAQVGDMFNRVLREFGGLDILVANAGIWRRALIDLMEEKCWDETLNVNLKGVYSCCHFAAKIMKEQRYGRIITISYTAGQRGETFYSHYAAAKGGIISFTKSLASELGPYGITVNSVAPGWVDTDMAAQALSDHATLEKIIDDIPLGRVATADDIAGAILFLASDLARHITGEVLNVNGGAVLCG